METDNRPPVAAAPAAPPVDRKRGRKLLWFLAPPALLVGFGLIALLEQAHAGKALAANTQAAMALPVDVIQAQQGAASNEIVLPATLQALDESPVYARTSGYIRAWYVDIGQPVKAGQVLALIDAPDVDQQLLHAKAMLGQSQANLTLAEVTSQRYRDLIKDNAVAQQQVDQNDQNLLAQRANVRAAAADVANLGQQQIYEKVIAPFDGFITERHADTGDLVNSGNSGPGAELFRVSKTTTMRVFIPVPEQFSQQMPDGMHVTVDLTELPGQSFDGRVARSARSINVLSRTLLVEVDVPNPADKLMPGAYANVHIELSAPTRPLLVPAGAILFQSAGPQIAIVDSQRRIELRNVSIGNDFGNNVEIVSGITARDEIVANPPDYLVNGMPVSIKANSNGKTEGRANRA